MFKKEIYSLLLFSFGLLFTCCGESATDDEEKDNNGQGSVSVETNYLPIADPYVMFYNNKYYAYGTGGTTAGEGFACFSSDDLKNWKREGQALSATDSYGTWGFWAPEVYYVESKKKFYLFYSAEEHICVATSTTPEGPFRQEVKQPIWSEKSIDTSLFIDDDGTPYLYFVRFTDGNVIWVAQMTDDLMSIKTETLNQCIKAEVSWELLQGKVAEGPMGPWVKYSKNPLLQGDAATGLVGTGHGAPFQCKDGSWKYIFHAHWSAAEIQPRTSYIKDFAISDQGVVTISGTVIKPRVLK